MDINTKFVLHFLCVTLGCVLVYKYVTDDGITHTNGILLFRKYIENGVSVWHLYISNVVFFYCVSYTVT